MALRQAGHEFLHREQRFLGGLEHSRLRLKTAQKEVIEVVGRIGRCQFLEEPDAFQREFALKIEGLQ